MRLTQVIPSTNAQADYIVTAGDHMIHIRADMVFLLLAKFDHEWARERLFAFIKQKHNLDKAEVTSIIRRTSRGGTEPFYHP